MGNIYSQSFPPKPTLTQTNVPNQNGKVFIVTGGASGVGFELCKILYNAGGKVYIAGRSKTNADSAISKIKSDSSSTTGELLFLQLSLDDLATIKPAVESFTAAESKLDVLWLNAGVAAPPKGSVSPQGHELHMATNVLGHYLFTQLLLPTLERTAKTSGPASVRVVWTSSLVVDLAAPKGGGLDPKDLDNLLKNNQQANYALSKTANWFLAGSLADQAGKEGVLSITQNPGNLKTQLTRHIPKVARMMIGSILYHARYGAYTELYAGLSPDLNIRDGGGYIVPWGRKHTSPKPDLLAALKSKQEGGTGAAQTFAEWCEKQTAGFR